MLIGKKQRHVIDLTRSVQIPGASDSAKICKATAETVLVVRYKVR